MPGVVAENSATQELAVSTRHSVIELLPITVRDWSKGEAPAWAPARIVRLAFCNVRALSVLVDPPKAVFIIS